MAYNDTLFQLGMDLTRSSPAQEEDTLDRVHAVHGDRHDNGIAFTSSHVIADVHGARTLGSPKAIERSLRDAFALAGAAVEAVSASRADVRGWVSGKVELVTGVARFDACPSKSFVALDVKCVPGLRPERLMMALADAFGAREVMLKKDRTVAELARMRSPVVAMPKRMTKPVSAKKRAEAA